MFLLAVGLSVVQGKFREQWASTSSRRRGLRLGLGESP